MWIAWLLDFLLCPAHASAAMGFAEKYERADNVVIRPPAVHPTTH